MGILRGQTQEISTDDYNKDMKNGTERVMFKSFKGATIIIDDFDGNEYLKIIDQAGQTFTMGNRGDMLPRRNGELGVSSQSFMELTNNRGEKVRIEEGKVIIDGDETQINSKKVTIPNWEKLGHGGDPGSAFLSGASMGAGTGAIIGSFFGPMGNVIGGVAGALVGGITGWISAANANKEAQEANTKAIESQTKATTDLLGEGVSAIDALEAKREIARGGGIVSLNSGNYAIDYVKSSYAGFATGLDYVPYDDYVVRVHKGEAIVTADAARKLREKDPNFWNTPMNDDYNIIGALKEQTDSIVSAVNGEKKYSPLTKAGPQQYTIKNQFA